MERLGHGEPRARWPSGGDNGYGKAECRFTLGREVVLLAQGGGGDGGAPVAETNQPVELRQR